MSKADPVAIVEASYDLDGSEEGWLKRLGLLAQPALDAGLGILAHFYDITQFPTYRVWSPILLGRLEVLQDVINPKYTVPCEKAVFGYGQSGPCGTVTKGYGDISKLIGYRKVLKPLGAEDLLIVNAGDPTGYGCILCAPLPVATTINKRTWRRWSRVAAHMAAGFRIRRGLEDLGVSDLTKGAEAVLDPGGRVQHAEGSAKASNVRKRLREAALAIDRARSSKRSDDDEALTLWRGLVAGRWSMVDHFDRDGRRMLVARRNAPEAPDPRRLSPRERQIVGFAALGHSNKLIAYELGLSTSAVSTQLANAMGKLGLKSRVELVSFFTRSRAQTDRSPDSS